MCCLEKETPIHYLTRQPGSSVHSTGAGAGAIAAGPASSADASKKKKRIRNWTADDRAVHRVFERSRREAFKERLQTLASLVPSLQSVDPNRLSKHVVVDESITFIKAEQRSTAHSLRTVDALLAEREGLLSELNRWRASAGLDVRLPQDLPADTPTQSPMIRQGSMRAVEANPGVDWVAGPDMLPGGGDDTALLEEPEPFGAPELELDSSLDLMQMPVGSASSAGVPGPPMGGASWSPSATDFAMPALQADFGDLFSTKGMAQQTITQTYGLPLTEMEMAQEEPGDRPGEMDINDPMPFVGNHAHIYSGSI
ncbi:cAMP-dependent protein kinase regulatory subunit [Purpureocillium lavendulum]|uniref:cAMP-dependent protein kinase regulatory subunit n=1 Tax=Purpureocillium lavendulum TaxID=1247861 RepID=A0AB34FW85_9HYPO|nr:cAMP-dependent protein kinase regulatory subunit [Purpureocillium lavendulum]